jgi:hypothetical protein
MAICATRKHLIWSSLSTRPDVDEQYLAEAVDACDLERRMRNLEFMTARPTPACSLVCIPVEGG